MVLLIDQCSSYYIIMGIVARVCVFDYLCNAFLCFALAANIYIYFNISVKEEIPEFLSVEAEGIGDNYFSIIKPQRSSVLTDEYSFFGFLNKSLASVECSKPFTEIPCSKWRTAKKVIADWEESSGVSNGYLWCKTNDMSFYSQISTEIVCLAMAILTNRSLLLKSRFIRQTNRIITDVEMLHDVIEKHPNDVQDFNSSDLFSSHYSLENSHKLYRNMNELPLFSLYTNMHMHSFIVNSFGYHAAFFLSNYIYRFHSFNNLTTYQNYIGIDATFQDVNSRTYRQLTTQIRKKIRYRSSIEKTDIALASDSKLFLTSSEREFFPYPQKFQISYPPSYEDSCAIVSLLLKSKEKYLIVQSNISRVTALMSGVQSWFLDFHSLKFFIPTSSQAFLINMFYNPTIESLDSNRININDDNEKLLRKCIRVFSV